MQRFLLFFLVFGPLLGLQAQDSQARVLLSLRSGYTQSTPQSAELTASSDWALSYGTDVSFELNSTGRLRPTIGVGLEVTNVNTVVEHGFIVNEGFADERIDPRDINVRTRLTNLSVPVQLNWFPGKADSDNNFFVFLRSDLLIGLGARGGRVELAEGVGFPPDRRLRRGLPVEQADIAHFLGFGAGWEKQFGQRGRVVRLQPMVRFSTLDVLDDPNGGAAPDRLNYLRATGVLEFGLTVAFGF